MSVHVMFDTKGDQAVLYCSTSDWAFGPVFQGENHMSADERAEAFLRWLKIDPRQFGQDVLERKFYEWRAQEAQQYQREREEEFS